MGVPNGQGFGENNGPLKGNHSQGTEFVRQRPFRGGILSLPIVRLTDAVR